MSQGAGLRPLDRRGSPRRVVSKRIDLIAGMARTTTPVSRSHLSEWTGDPEPQDATALRWVRPAELRGLEMPPADLPFIPILEALL